jgi:hypothetical protein
MAINRGRSTQSAYSRTAIGLIFCGSTGMAICMISPMIELIGPMRGTTPVGQTFLHRCQPLGDHLPRAEDVGAPVEGDVEEGQAR